MIRAQMMSIGCSGHQPRILGLAAYIGWCLAELQNWTSALPISPCGLARTLRYVHCSISLLLQTQ